VAAARGGGVGHICQFFLRHSSPWPGRGTKSSRLTTCTVEPSPSSPRSCPVRQSTPSSWTPRIGQFRQGHHGEDPGDFSSRPSAIPVLDFHGHQAVAEVAHKHGLPLIRGRSPSTNPRTSCRAFEHGADIVVNSLTKWIGGHGAAIGGIMVDSGKFNWKDNPRFPLFNQPDSNYHGLKWAHDLPAPLAPIAFALRFRTVPLRNLGAAIAPDNPSVPAGLGKRYPSAWTSTARTR